jgi:hypothetical protein
MLALSAKQLLFAKKLGLRNVLESRVLATATATTSNSCRRFKSGSPLEGDPSKGNAAYKYPFDENGEASTEVVSFPYESKDEGSASKPVILNAKEHAVGYLSRILNARVYEAAVETELQEAKNLSTVSNFAVNNGSRSWLLFSILF